MLKMYQVKTCISSSSRLVWVGHLRVTPVKCFKCEVTGCQPTEGGGGLDMNVLVGVTVRSPASQLVKRSCSSGGSAADAPVPLPRQQQQGKQ